jgi:zinc transport system substrate-binding protein
VDLKVGWGSSRAPGSARSLEILEMEITWSGKTLVVLGLVLALTGCGSGEPAGEPATGESGGVAGTGTPAANVAAGEEKLLVYTVNYPLAFFAGRIGDSGVRVELPVPGDIDPAFWAPEAESILAFQQADLILLNGAGYAGWVRNATLPTSRMVDTSSGLAERFIVVESDVTHSHGPAGDHTHGETAFTTWLDPTLAVEQAAAVREALIAARPAAEAAFQEGYVALEADLLQLDGALEEIAAVLSEQPLLASPPVYQYLARRYGLRLKSVHFEPDAFPDEKSWRELEELLREHPARWMLWEGEPLEETATRLQELGVGIVVFEPCGNRPATGDYLVVMRENVEGLKEIPAPSS